MAREDRYIVVKKSHLTPEQLSKLKSYMHLANVGTVPAVVVEADWPEYEPVWKMIEDRVAGRHRQSSSNAGGVEAAWERLKTLCCDRPTSAGGLFMVNKSDFFAALASLSTPAEEGEGERCQKCGHGNPSWSAPSPLWNAVIRGGSIDGEPLFGDMVCASCFMELAEQAGIASNWRVDAQRVNVPLETTTPTGREWDADQWLWMHPDEASTAQEVFPHAGKNSEISHFSQEEEGRWTLVHCSHCDELPQEDKS
jgi:hypothetical protein